MIAFYGCIGAAVLLFVFLFLLGAGQEPDDDQIGDVQLAERREISCPSAVVQQVFSSQDLAYVAREQSPSLRRFYLSERRRVAIGWIRRTSTELSLTMRDHVRASREKEDIRAATEATVLLQYLRLRCLCGLLLGSALIVRPSALQELAVYASELSHKLDSGRLGIARAPQPQALQTGTRLN